MKRFSPRNSILFWLGVLVAAVGALIVFTYHLVHAGTSRGLPPMQSSEATAVTRISLAAQAAETDRLRAEHLAALKKAMNASPHAEMTSLTGEITQ